MPATIDQFVENLLRSRLLSEAELAEFQQALEPERKPSDAQGLARELFRAGRLTKFQASAVYHGKVDRLVLGEYVVLDEIGRGGMGQVLRARHRTMDRIVAVKVILGKKLGSTDAVQRFRREVQVAARLMHANIVTAYDAGEHKGAHYLVTEFVDGEDLAKVLQERGPFPPHAAVDCILQAARGLEYAHQQGVVHRDVKPANLLLDREGTVKVLDMGLARLDEAIRSSGSPRVDTLTQSGCLMGTLDYMAPEQAEDTRTADHRADVYSLGCTFYQLVTGHKPYKGDTPMQLLLSHRDDPIPSLSKLRDDLPAELDAICLGMMAKRPEDRYQSMARAIGDLQAWLNRQSAEAPESSVSGDSALKEFLRNVSRKGPSGRAGYDAAQQETVTFAAGGETHVAPPEPPAPSGRRRILGAALLAAAGVAVAIAGLSYAFLRNPGDQAAVEEELPERPPPDDTDDEMPPPRPEPQRWEVAWEEVKAQAGALIEEQRFIEAEAEYQELKERFVHDELDTQIAEALAGLKGRAESDYKDVAAEVEQLRAANNFDDARKALQVVIDQYGVETLVEDARGLLFAVNEDEQKAKDADRVAEEEEAKKRAIARFRENEDTYALAIGPADELAAVWDFPGALAALEEIRFDEESLAARLAHRRQEVQRLVELKRRMIDQINAADPPLEKKTLGLRGRNGLVTGADDVAIAARLSEQETESVTWGNLNPAAAPKLLELVTAPDSPDDRLAAALLTLACQEEVDLANSGLLEARDLGANIDPHLTRFAAAEFLRALDLFDGEQFVEADTTLEKIETSYGQLPWLAVNRQAFDAAREFVKREVAEPGPNPPPIPVIDPNLGIQVSATFRITLKGQGNVIKNLAFSPDGSVLASSDGSTAFLWPTVGLPRQVQRNGQFSSLGFLDQTTLIYASGAGNVSALDPWTGESVQLLESQTGSTYAIAFSRDWTKVAFALQDMTIKLFSVGEKVGATLAGHTGNVQALAFSPDGSLLASGSDDHSVKLWSTKNGSEVRTLDGHPVNVNCVVFSPTDGLLVSAGGGVILWDIESGEELRRIQTNTDNLVFSPDGRILANDKSGVIWLYDPETAIEYTKFARQSHGAGPIAFSPDGRTLAAAANDMIDIWEIEAEPIDPGQPQPIEPDAQP